MAGYTEQLVAFIDLLGFRQAVQDGRRADELLELLTKLRELAGDQEIATRDAKTAEDWMKIPSKNGLPNFISSGGGHRTDFRPAVTAFSDSILISFDISELRCREVPDFSTLTMLRMLIGYLAGRALENGLLIRGGISIGNLYQHDGVAIGPGLVKSYDLEFEDCHLPKNNSCRRSRRDSVAQSQTLFRLATLILTA